MSACEKERLSPISASILPSLPHLRRRGLRSRKRAECLRRHAVSGKHAAQARARKRPAAAFFDAGIVVRNIGLSAQDIGQCIFYGEL